MCIFVTEIDFLFVCTELTRAELQELYRRAVALVVSRHPPKPPAVCLYMTRNREPEYFDLIMNYHNGIMRKYMKNNNGDKASLINGQIEGLFFGTAVDKDTLLPPNWSYFGPKRLNVPAHVLITPHVKLYFADFYCNKTAHHVTIVLCHPGSAADYFCQERLIELNIYKNFFLWLRQTDLCVMVNNHVWVEVLYTEDLHVPTILNRHAVFNTVPSSGCSQAFDRATKNPNCKVCNLYM